MSIAQQREFLHLAGTYLACRWCAMGNMIPACLEARRPLWYQLRGMRDYAAEMRLLLEEVTPCNRGQAGA